METTPDTFYYMALGYSFLFGLPFLYILSWLMRQRNLHKDLEVLKEIEKK